VEGFLGVEEEEDLELMYINICIYVRCLRAFFAHDDGVYKERELNRSFALMDATLVLYSQQAVN